MQRFHTQHLSLRQRYAHLACCAIMMIAFAGQLWAQKEKIDWDDDLILVNGQPYAKMIRRTDGLLSYEYSVSGLTGPELIYVKAVPGEYYYNSTLGKQVQQWYHEFNFIGSGSKAAIKYGAAANPIAKIIAQNKLIAHNAIDPEAERRFIQLFNGTTPSAAPVPQPSSPAVVVNVNNGLTPNPGSSPEANTPAKSKSPVTVNGNDILRDGAVIGKFREVTTASAYSQKTRVVTIYNDGGEKVAEAYAPAENPQEWTIRILSDGKETNLLYDAPKELETLFKWLADKGHLSVD